MTKRQTIPNNGLASSAPKRPQRGKEHPSPSAAPAHQTEEQEMTQQEVDDPSTEEEHGVSEALMESYNG